LGRCDTGLQTTAWLSDGSDAQVLAEALAKQGIEAVPLSYYALRWPLTHGMHLGFGAVSNRELKRGVEVLRAVLTRLTPTSS
jgi:GntR family transcriptional regulator/MocR family aminotransferase